jgi:hypothetical protein
MTQPPTLTDRLRVERAVWMLDARLQDLPRKSRIARRRELRQNLIAAAEEVGARQAVGQLGEQRALAAGYLAAEYGDLSPRPSWTAAAAWIAVVDIVMLSLDHVAAAAFRAGVAAITPHATGTLHWPGVSYLISNATYTYTNGTATTVGGAWTAWVYVLMLGGAVLAGRLWRLLPRLRRHQDLEAADVSERQRRT